MRWGTRLSAPAVSSGIWVQGSQTFLLHPISASMAELRSELAQHCMNTGS